MCSHQLSKVRLHIGLPVGATKTAAFVNTYFADFLWRKLNFIDHLESRWTFSKKKMEEQLVARNLTEKYMNNLIVIKFCIKLIYIYQMDCPTVSGPDSGQRSTDPSPVFD